MKNLLQFLSVFVLVCFSYSASAQNSVKDVNATLQKLVASQELQPQDILDWIITSEHVSRTSGVQHTYFRQQVDGIQIYGAESSVHTLPNGKTLASHNGFIRSAAQRVSGTRSPQITEVQALDYATRALGVGGASGQVVSRSFDQAQSGVLQASNVSRSPVPFKLMYHFSEKEGLRLAWDLSIESKSTVNWWNVRVDASTGELLDTVDWTVQCASEENHVHDLSAGPSASATAPVAACAEENVVLGNYEVYASPDESPQHGSTARSIVSNPDDGSAIGSPFGWHDTNGVAGNEYTITRGNNTHTYEDGDNQGYSPDGGANLDFTTANTNGVDFSVDTNYSASVQSEDAALSNLFYWTNIIHDMIFIYGMDEASGNFQETNYSGLGNGGDAVDAEAQDGSGTCNANFSTPADGGTPRMQMYVCGSRDGDYDNGVIVHEYGHGISIRMTGGGGNSGCLFGQEQMGEGWSDWYGMVMTIQPGDVADAGVQQRGMGTWLFGQGPNGGGIRPQPYSTDIVNGNTYTYDTIKTGVSVPHGVGSVWAEILWEMTWALIGDHGWDANYNNFTGDVNQDAGNVQALALVTEGLKLQPCGPGFVTGRDAIIAADQAIYGGANYCTLWEAFAKRGLGFSADQGSVNSRSDGTEAFDLPVATLETVASVCISEGAQIYNGAGPLTGTFSGTGVTDSGDGVSYTFDPEVAGVGVHTVSYTSTICGITSTATSDIEVTSATPEIVCQDVTVDLDSNGQASITEVDVVANLLPGEYVVDQTGTFAPEDIAATGTTVSLGDDTVSTALPIGFSFNFYDVDYTDFYISSNGFITFNSVNDDACCNGQSIPTEGAAADNFIAFAWEDVNPSAGGTIRYETVGTAPNRKLVMEFDAVPFWNTSSFISSQVHLFEGSNRIEIHSASIPLDGLVSQGIENQDGTQGLPTPGRNAEVWAQPATNDVVAFYREVGGPAPSCGFATTISFSQSDFNCGNVGDNQITVTIDDGNGNTNTCIATVTVNQGDAPLEPVAVCQDITVQLDANGTASIIATDVDNGSSICGGGTANLSVDTTTFGCDDIGENTVTLTVSDGGANSTTCTATVTVIDSVAPDVVCQNITVELDLDGNASITAAQIDNGSSDFCGIDTMSLDVTTFSCDSLGDNTVALTVTDVNGNSSTCNAIVTVTDTVVNTVACQSITVELDANGQATITATQVDNGSDDACGIDTMSLDITTFTCDNIGDNTVILTVTDVNGNSESCTTTVTVEDNIELSADGPGDISQATTNNDDACETIITYDPVTGSDNCNEDQITVAQIAGLGSGEAFPVGTTTEEYEITGADGTVIIYSFDVTVTDGTDPEIENCPTNTTETVNEGESFAIPDYSTVVTLTDNCTTTPVYSQAPAAGVLVQPGTTTSVTITATDDEGNTETCTFNVSVEETLSLGENTLSGGIEMYPNPASSIVTIAYAGSQQLSTAQIIDMSGKIVSTISLQSGLQENKLDVSNLASGVYFVQISSTNEAVIKKLVIK